MSDLSIVFGALFALVLSAWRLVRGIRKDAVEDVQNIDKLRDALHADDVRRDAQTAKETTNAEAHGLGDDDISRRLHEARKRTR